MLKEFEDIINEMDSELSEYSQKITYEQKLSNLKEKYKPDRLEIVYLKIKGKEEWI